MQRLREISFADTRALLLVTARGGSKGLPRKNLLSLGGIPLVGRAAWTAREALRQFCDGSQLVCSTDDNEIAAVARDWGAETPFLRPTALATDDTASIDVVLHCLDALAPTSFDLIVLLQPTSPLTEVKDIFGAVELHLRTGDPIVSVCLLEHPAAWQFTIDAERRLRTGSSAPIPKRRQEATICYRPNGAVYVATPDQLRTSRSFFGPETRASEMPPERSVDIDTEADLLFAETLVRSLPPVVVTAGSRQIGRGHPCFIIAEAGVNHNGSMDLARRLIDAAHAAGADAVKFQTFQAEKLISASAPKAEYQARQTGSEQSQLEMVKSLELSFDDFRRLKAHCDQKGILFLSTPFDEASADFLHELGVPLIKVPSGELTNLPLLEHLAAKRTPLIVSTGMASLEEVAGALTYIRENGNPSVVLLHCVSNYPASAADVNLRAMETMAHAFRVPVGYSDHTLGPEIAIAAVSLGACVIEKHFTLDRSLAGPDHQASSTPDELADLVRSVRAVESAFGDGRKEPATSEANTAAVARKSLVAASALRAGTILTPEMIAIKRPGTGLSPALFYDLVGRRLAQDLQPDALFVWDMIE